MARQGNVVLSPRLAAEAAIVVRFAREARRLLLEKHPADYMALRQSIGLGDFLDMLDAVGVAVGELKS